MKTFILLLVCFNVLEMVRAIGIELGNGNDDCDDDNSGYDSGHEHRRHHHHKKPRHSSSSSEEGYSHGHHHHETGKYFYYCDSFLNCFEQRGGFFGNQKVPPTNYS